jgi:hypothetical protein
MTQFFEVLSNLMIINKEIESVSILSTAERLEDCKSIEDFQISKSIVQIHSNCF